MSEKKISWADIADEEDALAAELARRPPPPPKWVPPHARQDKQKLKNIFSKEKPSK
jgi:hypothetical protein